MAEINVYNEVDIFGFADQPLRPQVRQSRHSGSKNVHHVDTAQGNLFSDSPIPKDNSNAYDWMDEILASIISPQSPVVEKAKASRDWMDDIIDTTDMLPLAPITLVEEEKSWEMPDDFLLPDSLDEARELREAAIESLGVSDQKTTTAKYVSERGLMPPMSSLIPIIRELPALTDIKSYIIVDSNSPAFTPAFKTLFKDAKAFVSYRDETVEVLSNTLTQPSVLPPSGQCADFVFRPCTCEGESIYGFQSLLSTVNRGGIFLGFVEALSFLDASPGDNDSDAYLVRQKIFSAYRMLGAVRYASNTHLHNTHIDLVAFIRTPSPINSKEAACISTGKGFMPWQKANAYYLQQPGLISDSRSMFSSLAIDLLVEKIRKNILEQRFCKTEVNN